MNMTFNDCKHEFPSLEERDDVIYIGDSELTVSGFLQSLADDTDGLQEVLIEIMCENYGCTPVQMRACLSDLSRAFEA